MSSCVLQFYALNEEILAFIDSIRSENKVFMFTTDDLRLRQCNLVNDDSELKIENNQRFFFIRRVKDDLEYDNNNSLIIYVGREKNDELRESYMETYGEGETFTFWKKMISKQKKKLLKGAYVCNASVEKKVYYKNIYYTQRAQEAYRNGVTIRPLAGNCCCELEKEQV